jgi:hypothetical protein
MPALSSAQTEAEPSIVMSKVTLTIVLKVIFICFGSLFSLLHLCPLGTTAYPTEVGLNGSAATYAGPPLLQYFPSSQLSS